MGVETPVGHNLGLRRKCHGAKQCKDCGCKELFHVAKIHIFRNRQGEQQEKNFIEIKENFGLTPSRNARESIVETFVEKIGSKWNKLEKYS